MAPHATGFGCPAVRGGRSRALSVRFYPMNGLPANCPALSVPTAPPVRARMRVRTASSGAAAAADHRWPAPRRCVANRSADHPNRGPSAPAAVARASSSRSGTRSGSPIRNRPPVRATSHGSSSAPRRGHTAAAASAICPAASRRMPAATGSSPAHAATSGANEASSGGPVGTRIEHAGQVRRRTEHRLQPGQQRGRSAAPPVVGAHGRIEAGPADPGAAAAVAQQMTPAVGPAPARQVRAERDHAGAAGDDRPRPLSERSGVRGHRVGGQREPPYARVRSPGPPEARRAARPPSVAMPAAPIATAATVAPSAARSCSPAWARSSRVAGSSCSSRCPASIPAGPVRTGAGADRGGHRLLGPDHAERHPQPRTARVHPEDVRPRGGGHGSRQSTGCAPWRSSSSLARLNGREPKKPRSADMGEGCDGLDRREVAQQRPQIAGVTPPQDRHQRRAPRRPAPGSPARSPPPSPCRGAPRAARAPWSAPC